MDAQALPIRDGCLANIVAVDVLHHLENPVSFLREASRVLQPGGRLILIEPAITPLSWVFFKLLHPEPVIMSVDPLKEVQKDPARKPFDANQAIPTLMFGQYRSALADKLPQLKLVHHERLSFFAYPLSGGFRPWSLIPAAWVPPLLRLETRLTPLIGSLAAFRLFVVMQKI